MVTRITTQYKELYSYSLFKYFCNWQYVFLFFLINKSYIGAKKLKTLQVLTERQMSNKEPQTTYLV